MRTLPIRNTAEIITIGDELLKGSVVNTNASFLGKELFNLGFECRTQVSCPDQISEISSKLAEALTRASLIILSGGLGPTPDDVTRSALAHFFRVPLIFSKSQFEEIRKHYRRYGKKVPEIVRQEAMFPEQSSPLINRHGIALGFYFSRQESLIVVLPGVPAELEKMFHELVRPLIQRRFRKMKPKISIVVKMAGISEPEVMKQLGKDFFDEAFDFGIYPSAGEVTLRIFSDSSQVAARLEKKLKSRLSRWIYSLQDISFAKAVGRLLLQKNKTVAFAESCTGGLAAWEMIQVPGASRYVRGGVVAYSNAIKKNVLRVDRQILKDKGAVSEEMAKAMAKKIRQVMKAHFGISITGIAGPGGGTPLKPVGLVYIAIASEKKTRVWRHHFYGDRVQVQRKAVKKSLEHLWREISD